MGNTGQQIDLLPDITLPEEYPHKKRHDDTLAFVGALARLIVPLKGKQSGMMQWQQILQQSIGLEEYTEDLTWQQLLDIWEWLLFDQCAGQLLKARAWVEKYYKKEEET